MKKRISLLLVLGAFYWMNTATSISKGPFFVCDTPINNYLWQTDSSYSYYASSVNDTVLIRTYKDSAWDQKSSEICRILKDSCLITTPFKILVLDSTNDINQWNTPYGKRIFLKQCP